MAFPVRKKPIVTYYCAKPDLKRNLPKEQAAKLAQQILKLTPPKPVNSALPEDEKRFKYEHLSYEFQKDFLQKRKAEFDDLAFAVEMDLNPKKRKKAIQAYQTMYIDTPEAIALQEKLKGPNKLIAKKVKCRDEAAPIHSASERGIPFPG